MKPRVDHIWHDEWLKENIAGFRSYTKATEAYQEKFQVDICVAALKNHCRYVLGIRKSRGPNYRRITQEQADWLKDIYPRVGVKKARDLWNERYGDHLTATCIKQIARHKCDIVVDPEVATANKLKAAHGEGSKRALREPGDTRMECGRLVMKDTDGQWKSAGRCVWEKTYGKIPVGYALIALNGDTTDIRPENLEIVPWSYLGMLQRNDFFSSDPEITKAGVIWCDLKTLLDADRTDI